METTYVRLGYIDERATIFVLRVAFAFLVAASVFSLLATLVYVRAENTAATYVAALSTIINLVAAWHYNEIVKVRVGQGVSTDAEWAIDALRCVISKTQTYNPHWIFASLEQPWKSMQHVFPAGTRTGP